MRVDELESTLTARLVDEGVDLERPNLAAVWRAFQAFARTSVDGVDSAHDEDVLLFESGARPGRLRGLGEVYELLFERQVHPRDPSGRLTGMVHVTCQVWLTTTPAFAGLPVAEEWGAGSDGAAAWSRRVSGTPAMQRGLADGRPILAMVAAGGD